MNHGLSVSNVVNVDVFISPIAAGYRNFGTLLIVTDEEVIDVGERVRFYANIDEFIEEFGGTGPGYDAALLYFSQLPRPNLLYVGRWARVASKAVLHGGPLVGTALDLATWTAITAGAMTLVVDGVSKVFTAMNFSAVTNFNQVAAVMQAATTGVIVTWDAAYERFDVKSASTGVTSTLGYATGPGGATDVALKANLKVGLANAPINGIAAETLLAGVQACADRSAEWYGVAINASVVPPDNDLVDVSAYIEGTDRNRVHFITSQTSSCLDPLSALDIGSRLKGLRMMRSYVQYSSMHKAAAVSAFGRIATVDFEAMNTTMTLKFKQLPGVGIDLLTETQNKVLRSKNINIFVQYDNDTAILQEGVMANGYFVDEVHNADWYANALQVDVWNVLYQSQTKIPQTDDGIHQLTTACERTSERAVNNGMLAAGMWNGNPIGILKPGMRLSRGYYVYAQSVDLQPPAIREQRIAPTIQIAAKLAGAVHFVSIQVFMNR